MRPVLAFALLVLGGCGAAQRVPTDEERQALARVGSDVLACEGPIRLTPDPESMRVEVCVEEGPVIEGDVISTLAGCRRTEWVEAPIDGSGAWRVEGCGRSAILVCGLDCDRTYGCFEWELARRTECVTYRRG